MPDADQLAAFYARGEELTREDVARVNKLAEAVQSISWVNDEPPKDSDEYEARILRITEAAESIGYTVVRENLPDRVEARPGFVMKEPVTDTLYFYNGPSNLIHSVCTRLGHEVTGLIAAESWIRAEVHEKSRAEVKKKRLAEQNRKFNEEQVKSAKNAEIQENPSALADRLTVLESKFDVLIQRLDYLSVLVKGK